MSNLSVQDAQAIAMRNYRMDTALRVSGLRKALDDRDDVIEVLMKIGTVLAEGIEKAENYAGSSENFDIGELLAILNGAMTEAKEISEHANSNND